jgi:hypothetical protein
MKCERGKKMKGIGEAMKRINRFLLLTGPSYKNNILSCFWNGFMLKELNSDVSSSRFG